MDVNCEKSEDKRPKPKEIFLEFGKGTRSRTFLSNGRIVAFAQSSCD